MRPSAVAAAVIGVLAGCTFEGVNFSETSFRCDEDEPCPSGFDCVAGRCTSGGIGGDAAPPDACTPRDAGGPPTISLEDDFDDGDAASFWTPFSGDAMVVEQGGELVCRPASNSPMERFAGYRTAGTYDLQGHRVFVQITAMVNAATEAQARFRAGFDDLHHIYIIQENGALRFGTETGGIETDVGSPDYVPTAHRYWQMREEGGEVVWEVSGDGVAWNELGRESAPFSLDAVQIELSAGSETRAQDPSEVHYDNLNKMIGACL